MVVRVVLEGGAELEREGKGVGLCVHACFGVGVIGWVL